MRLRSKIPRGGPAGFTLIELMLAVGVLAMILAMLAGSFGAVAQSKINGESRMYTNWEGRAVLSRMSNELRGAVQTSPIDSRVMLLGTARKENRVPLDELSISTLSPGGRRSIELMGAEELVTYSAVANPRRRGWFMLQRSQGSALGSTGGGFGGGGSLVIAENLVSIHLRYFDGQTWREEWSSDQYAQGDQLPRAVSIDLNLGASGGRVLNFSTIVNLPMAVSDW
ncbi:MAG: prepilin-type N-terminal cleavage/methylation domain-containing protein [Candidatus Binataceae bacterium]